jgi:hypothetical protein
MADELEGSLRLSPQLAEFLRQEGITSVEQVRHALSTGVVVPKIGPKRQRELRDKLAEHDKRNSPNPASTLEPRFFWLGVFLFVAALALAAWGFSRPALGPHQYWIMEWLFPLASGFAACAFVGSLAVRRTGLGPGLIVAATGGFGVWFLTFTLLHAMLPAPTRSPRPVTLRIQTDGRLVAKPFDFTYQEPSGAFHSFKGTDGELQFALPADVHVLSNPVVELPCYEQVQRGPVEVIEGRPIVINLRKVPTAPKDSPLPPTAFPDPRAIIPDKDRPSPEVLNKKVAEPASVVLVHENHTGEYLRLLLYSFDASRANNPWHVLPCDHCVESQEFNGFTEPTGWFAFIARKENGSAQYLGTINVYAKARPRVVIKALDSKLVAEFD